MHTTRHPRMRPTEHMLSLSFPKVQKLSLAEFEQLVGINIAHQFLYHKTVTLVSCWGFAAFCHAISTKLEPTVETP